MVREIVIYGAPVLREKCVKVEQVSREIEELAADMVETMYDAQGVGLAAPQVGEAVQLAVVDIGADRDDVTFVRVDGEDVGLSELMPLIFFDPEVEGGSERESMEEGCLSIPELRASVRRPAAIKASLSLLDGRRIQLECDGLLSRAIQHEVDHLNGILFIDRLSSAAKLRARRELKRMFG
jgi:peptide deformylase